MRSRFGVVPIAAGLSPTVFTSGVTRASSPTPPRRPGSGVAEELPSRPANTLAKWQLAKPGVTDDPELFPRDILPRFRTVKLSEIAEAIGCSKASASDIRRGKRTSRLDVGGAW